MNTFIMFIPVWEGREKNDMMRKRMESHPMRRIKELNTNSGNKVGIEKGYEKTSNR